MKTRIIYLTGVVGCLFLLVSTSKVKAAEDAEAEESSGKDEYPSLDAECLNDHASVIKKRDKAKIKSLCKKADKDNAPFMVVTVGSLSDYDPQPFSIDLFVQTIFNDWDTGYEQKGQAVMLFVALKEREFRIFVGDEYIDRLRNKASKIIRTVLAADFRYRKHSRGIRRTMGKLFDDVVKPHIRAKKKAQKAKNQRL